MQHKFIKCSVPLACALLLHAAVILCFVHYRSPNKLVVPQPIMLKAYVTHMPQRQRKIEVQPHVSRKSPARSAHLSMHSATEKSVAHQPQQAVLLWLHNYIKAALQDALADNGFMLGKKIRVSFYITRDGHLTDIRMLRATGLDSIDNYIRAVLHDLIIAQNTVALAARSYNVTIIISI